MPRMQVQSSIREIAVLQAASEMILSSVDADTVLHQILLIVRNYFDVPHCAVMLVDQGTNELYTCALVLASAIAARTRRMKIGKDGICGHVAQSRVPTYVPEVSKDPRYVAFDARMRSEMCLPLIVRDEVIGVLDLESDKPDHFTDDMIGLLALFAGQSAVAIENSRLYTAERRRMRQIEFVNLIARSSNNTANREQLLTTLCDILSDTFDGPQVAILLRDQNGSFNLAAFGGSVQPDPLPYRESARNGVIAEALAARMNVVVNSVEERMAHKAGWIPCLPTSRSELAVPLVSLGETLGVIVISHTMANPFSPEDRSIAQAMGDVCATALRNVQLADELRRVANTDTLTGLYNQRYFHVAVAQEITRARRFGKPFTALMFDLRAFRRFNEERGLDAGDGILKEIAHRLASSVRAIDTICRFSGDRFAVIVPEIGPSQVEPIQAKLLRNVGEVYHSPDGAVARFALVHYPQDGANELELIRHLLQRMDFQKPQLARAHAGVKATL